MKKFLKIFLVPVVVLSMIALSTKFIVNQGTETALLRLGELVKDNNGNVTKYEPGIYVKIPFLDTVKIIKDSLIGKYNNKIPI